MVEAGILREGDRVELIVGEIVEMPRPGRNHVAFVNNLNQLLVLRLAGSESQANARALSETLPDG